MDIYFEILEQELDKCEKHKQEYQLEGCYDVFNDVVLCTYQYIEKNHYNNKKLLKLSKKCLLFNMEKNRK